jgi:hypothetical protein
LSVSVALLIVDLAERRRALNNEKKNAPPKDS